MTKKAETLEEGLNRSASKKGLTGKERHRYIGGALHNMGKGRTRSGKKEPASKSHTSATHGSTTHKPQLVAPPKKAAYSAPTLKKRELLKLTVKENKAASAGKNYPLYSIYKDGKQYGDSAYRKRSKAVQEAKLEMDAHNDIRGVHTRGRLT